MFRAQPSRNVNYSKYKFIQIDPVKSKSAVMSYHGQTKFIKSQVRLTVNDISQSNKSHQIILVSKIHIFLIIKLYIQQQQQKKGRGGAWGGGEKTISIPLVGIYLYSVGTLHGNLLKSLVTMSRMTYFILWGPLRKLRQQTVKTLGEDLEKKKHMHARMYTTTKNRRGEWTGKVEIRTRRFLAADKVCMAIF